ncbi:MAG TPA: hypothetical protein VFA47_06710 [Candidatus Manganitrophaceae bacterium]|nr:hypothetical protein [Candidatus Manganitrophaceae bacterium]
MDRFNPLIHFISRRFGLLPGQIYLVGALLLLILLLCFRRNFWGTFKFLLIAGIFGVISYYAYNFTLIGLEKKEALVNKPVDQSEGNP